MPEICLFVCLLVVFFWGGGGLIFGFYGIAVQKSSFVCFVLSEVSLLTKCYICVFS